MLGTGGNPCRLAATLLFCASILSMPAVCSACAHSQSDDVHIVARLSSAEPGSVDINPRSESPARRVRVDVDLVLVPTTVSDRLNRPVMNLGPQDFALYEDNAKQQIRYFSSEDASISVGLILDVSRSMTNKIETERAAVAQFFQNANPEDDYFVITLSDRPRIIADTTQSLDEIQNKLALVIPDGHTALLDAIYLGVSRLRAARYSRRVLLIISDGGDNHSHYTAKETRRMVEESGTLVYGIGVFDDFSLPVLKSLNEKLGDRLLATITEASGGRTITVDQREKIPEVAREISRELRQQYVLGYKSSNAIHDGKWRNIKVTVTARSGVPPLRAHYKRGYLAPDR